MRTRFTGARSGGRAGQAAVMAKSFIRRLLARFDRVIGEMNELLVVLAVSLGCFYLTVLAVLNMPQPEFGPERHLDYRALDAAVVDGPLGAPARPE
jgi:hypothetical protein